MARRPPELVYAVDEWPPPMRLVALGLQYAVLVSVYLIMIVLTARAAGASTAAQANLVSLGLVAGAAGVALQAYHGRFFGSGFLAPPVFSAIYLAPSILAAKHGGLAAVAGMTVFAGLVEIGMSRLLVRLRIVFQPLVTGFTVFIVGIQFGLVAITETLDIGASGQPDFPRHVLLGGLTFAMAVGLSIWGRGVFRLMCSLVALAVGSAAALLLGVMRPAAIASFTDSAWLALPDPSVLSWSFDLKLAPVFLIAGVAATIRVVGVITTAQRVNDADWKRPDVANLQGGVVGDGLGTVIAGLLGAIGMSVAPSMVAMSGATGATSRVIGFAAAAFLLVFAFMPRVSALIIGLPVEVVGGILLFTAAFLIAGGIGIMTLRGLDLRASFAVATALLIGIVSQLHPRYFAALPEIIRTMAGDMLTLSLVTMGLLTLIFRLGIRQKESTAWSAADDSLDRFRALLDKDARTWKLSPDPVQRAGDTVATLVRHLKDGDYLRDPVAITTSFDQLELMVELAYRGRPIALSSHIDEHLGAHEEGAMTAGLGHYTLGIAADRTHVLVNGDDVRVQLWFAG